MYQEKSPQDQWLDEATKGIRFACDRQAVRAELLDHLEDKAADLQRIFPDLDRRRILSRVLKEMGDPEELSQALAAVHKPWLGYLWTASRWLVGLSLCAALLCWGGRGLTALQEWNDVFSVNMVGAFLCTRAAIPKFVRRGGGCVINISSIWGETGASCEAAYSASKAALIGFTKAAAKELAPSGIRVNCVAAGMISTRMNGQLSEEERKSFVSAQPIAREGTAEEVASAVYFLSRQKYVTGEVLRVNGGALI